MSALVLDEEQILAAAEVLANLHNDDPAEVDFAEAERSIRAGEMDEWVAGVYGLELPRLPKPLPESVVFSYWDTVDMPSGSYLEELQAAHIRDLHKVLRDEGFDMSKLDKLTERSNA